MGLLFGVQDSNNFYMWQINAGDLSINPHQWSNGGINTNFPHPSIKDALGVDSILETPLHLTMKMEEGTVTSWINDVQKMCIRDRRYSDCICVSGTHGKTTTTAMLTQILLDADMDPSAVIGGKLKSINSYGRSGDSEIMTCEACEFVDTFLHLSPDIAVVLNIDLSLIHISSRI